MSFEIDTYEHRDRVRELINLFVNNLLYRAEVHDNSKLCEPELSGFKEGIKELETLKYGTEEYANQVALMKDTVEEHYRNNDHHIEHHFAGIEGMDLAQLIEMLCDWKAASMRHPEGDIYNSIQHAKKHYNLPDAIVAILTNTADRFFCDD